jgi:DNA repair protein RecN (Recombination protein N)
LQSAEDERRDRLDLARYLAAELEEARLAPGEHDELVSERALLRAAGEMQGVLGGVVDEIFDGDAALLDRLRAAERALARWEGDVKALEAPLEGLRAAAIHVEDAASALASLRDSIEDDPLRLDAVEERLAELERLEHKHRTDSAGLLQRRGELAAEIERLEGDEASLATLAADLARLGKDVAASAALLTSKRRAVAPKLERAVVAALASLGLERARLKVTLEPRAGADSPPEERFGPHGADKVELVLAANPGEDPRPLRHVASGGEAARIMLALRSGLRSGDAARALVFDEIDAGVGGRLGPEVGRHLRMLAERTQVLCVTHLPAIAAHAHVHLRAEKEVKRNRTRTTVVALAGEERVREVAAMIAGGADQATARAEATRLLAEAGA